VSQAATTPKSAIPLSRSASIISICSARRVERLDVRRRAG
jgi:hypothetical protein